MKHYSRSPSNIYYRVEVSIERRFKFSSPVTHMHKISMGDVRVIASYILYKETQKTERRKKRMVRVLDYGRADGCTIFFGLARLQLALSRSTIFRIIMYFYHDFYFLWIIMIEYKDMAYCVMTMSLLGINWTSNFLHLEQGFRIQS